MAKIIICENATYVFEDGRGEITKQMKAYNMAGVHVLIPYKEGTRLYKVNDTDFIVLEDLLGNIVPMGTEAEYLQKKESHTMRILSALAV